MWKYIGKERPPFAETPEEGQESVWDYPRPPMLSPDIRHVVVKLGNIIIADTTRAIRVLETASPPTFYIPPEDVDQEKLRRADGSSFCEWKGKAAYWDVITADSNVLAAGWSYSGPAERFSQIDGYYSFYPARVSCFVDGVPVKAQPGGFYGGWVTPDIAGPFKGEPGTGGW